MSTLGILFRAERVKLRKSWPLLTAVLAPGCQACFLAVIFWFSDGWVQMYRPGFRFWLELNYVVWNLVLLPVAAALLCALSWEQERDASAWNHLLVQPLPRSAHYLAKTVGHLGLLLLSQVLLFLVVPLAGWVLCRNPHLLMGPLPWTTLLRFAAYSALASAALAAFHTWLSMRIPGLWVALAAALVGTWLAQRWAGAAPFALPFLPWGLSGRMTLIFDRSRTLPWAQVPVSLLAAALMVWLGAADFVRFRETRS